MKKINLSITGCMGRMGQQLIRSAKKNKNFNLVSLTENRKLNKKIIGISPEFNSINAFKKAHVIVDFTVPKSTIEIIKIASKQKKKSGNRNNWFFKKGRKYHKKNLKKDSHFKSWKHEFRC